MKLHVLSGAIDEVGTEQARVCRSVRSCPDTLGLAIGSLSLGTERRLS